MVINNTYHRHSEDPVLSRQLLADKNLEKITVNVFDDNDDDDYVDDIFFDFVWKIEDAFDSVDINRIYDYPALTIYPNGFRAYGSISEILKEIAHSDRFNEERAANPEEIIRALENLKYVKISFEEPCQKAE